MFAYSRRAHALAGFLLLTGLVVAAAPASAQPPFRGAGGRPPLAEGGPFAQRVAVAHDSVIDAASPAANLNAWSVVDGMARIPLLTVHSGQYAILRWDLTRLAGASVAGDGQLELTTYAAQAAGGPDTTTQIRVAEVVGGDPAWDQKSVTFDSLTKGQPVGASIDIKAGIDAVVAARRGSKTYVAIPAAVLQRLIDRRALGLAIVPAGTVDVAFYASEADKGNNSAKLLFNVKGQPAPLLANIFQNHAVLQRDRPIKVWGTAAAGESVTVTFNGQQASGKAEASGHWAAELPASPAGGPYTLDVRAASGAAQTVSDVLVGDVFLCSGQSNMDLAVSAANGGQMAAMRGATDRIRLLSVPRLAKAAPLADFAAPAAWQPATGDSISRFSAACYYFGRELQATVNVPMGLVNASWGGTAIEPWMSPDGLKLVGGFDERLAILGVYATDEDAANQQMGELWQRWWKGAAPTLGEPWKPESQGSGDWTPLPEPMRDWKKWDVPALKTHDGMVWFRRTVTLTAAQAARPATIALGAIDEVDQTWINGRIIRNTFGWGTDRTYTIPAGVLKAGENQIVLNVLSTWDMGGMYGPAEKMAITFSDGTQVPIGGGWTYRMVPLTVGRPPRAPWEPISGMTTLYNGMIAPLGPFGVRAALWYQGETSADEPAGYEKKLAGLFSGWRAQFGAPLPFLVVQLPNFGVVPVKPSESGWAEIRDAERRAVAADAHAGLAVTIDIGEKDNLHPGNKAEVGARLARAGRAVIYGEKLASSGPKPLAATRTAGQIVVSFGDVDGGLVTYSAGQATGFELCGRAAQTCQFVSGTVKGNRVVLPVRGAVPPARVRFCWGDSPICNLSDASGLPVTPFELAIK
jgi:sialate O-acetylesterase